VLFQGQGCLTVNTNVKYLWCEGLPLYCNRAVWSKRRGSYANNTSAAAAATAASAFIVVLPRGGGGVRTANPVRCARQEGH
jgi:hypothetical protein